MEPSSDPDAMPAATADAPEEAGNLPTGWSVIAKNDSVVEIIDTLLHIPPRREFNKSELAAVTDVSRKSVHNHIDLLLHLGIMTEVPETAPTRYRFNPDSEVAKALIRLDGAVNQAGPYSDE